MTKDDVLRMALEAGFPLLGPARTDAAMRFAALVMEEDAKVCDEISMQAAAAWKKRYELQDQGREMGAEDCAEAIRARKPA